MALISTKGLGVKKLVILIQATTEQDQNPGNWSGTYGEEGHVSHSEDQSFSSDQNWSDSNESLGNRQHKKNQASHLVRSIMDSSQGVVEDKTTGQIQMSLLVMVMAMAQASLLSRDGMNQMKDINQEIVKNKETVLLLVQVRYLVMTNAGQAQDGHLAVSNMGLDQVNPSGYGQHRSSSGQSSGFSHHGTGIGQSSSYEQHSSTSRQSPNCSQHGPSFKSLY